MKYVYMKCDEELCNEFSVPEKSRAGIYGMDVGVVFETKTILVSYPLDHTTYPDSRYLLVDDGSVFSITIRAASANSPKEIIVGRGANTEFFAKIDIEDLALAAVEHLLGGNADNTPVYVG
jgi:hypothetical protein